MSRCLYVLAERNTVTVKYEDITQIHYSKENSFACHIICVSEYLLICVLVITRTALLIKFSFPSQVTCVNDEPQLGGGGARGLVCGSLFYVVAASCTPGRKSKESFFSGVGDT